MVLKYFRSCAGSVDFSIEQPGAADIPQFLGSLDN